MLPNAFPPWEIVCQQASRGLTAGVFETMVRDLRMLVRDLAGRENCVRGNANRTARQIGDPHGAAR
jgi:hypothetical protein